MWEITDTGRDTLATHNDYYDIALSADTPMRLVKALQEALDATQAYVYPRRRDMSSVWD